MSELPESNNSISEPNQSIGAPIPIYYPNNQIRLNGEDFATVVNTERTRALREITILTNSPRNATGGDGLEWAINHTDPNVGKHFQAHGLAKNPVEDLVVLMDKGLIAGKIFYSMPFIDVGNTSEAFGAQKIKTEGGLVLVSGYDEQFPQEGPMRLKYIIVGEEFIQTIQILRDRFKDLGIEIVPWHDAPIVLTRSYNEHNPDNYIEYQTVSESNPVRYPPKKTIHIPHTTSPSIIAGNAGSAPNDVW